MTPPELPSWIGVVEGGVALAVHAQPGARKAEVVGPHGDALKIRIDAPPVEGRANAALLEFVARRLGVPRRDVTLVAGDGSRHKRLRIEGLAPAEVLARLAR